MVTDLYDAIERRGLASYSQLTKEGKENLLNCELKPRKQFAKLKPRFLFVLRDATSATPSNKRDGAQQPPSNLSAVVSPHTAQ